MTLCVLLWANEGQDDTLSRYEDEVLALLGDHGATLLSRVRRIDETDGPREVQVIQVPDQAALDAYLTDPRRVAALDVRDRAIARTDIFRVEPVPSR